MHVISDDILLDIFGLLPPQDLAKMSASSKSLYCFGSHEDLWKAAVLEQFEGSFVWDGIWKTTYAVTLTQTNKKSLSSTAAAATDKADASSGRPGKRQKKDKKGGKKGSSMSTLESSMLQVDGFYSDLLYQPYFCASVDIDPSWLETDNIDRRKGLSVAQFIAEYEEPNKPVVITDALKGWKALKKWTRSYIGNYSMPMSTYTSYMDNNSDEMPWKYNMPTSYTGNKLNEMPQKYNMPTSYTGNKLNEMPRKYNMPTSYTGNKLNEMPR
eukprot:gene15937-22069_t